VLSDDTFVDFSELSTDPEVEKIEEEVEQLSETITAQGERLDDVEDEVAIAKANSAEALENSVQAVDDSADAIYKVNNLEGAWTGTSPILDFSTEAEYGTGANQLHYCYKDGLFYRAITTHVGEWDASHFEQISVFDLLKVLCGIEEIPTWESIKSEPTSIGELVIYNNKLYKFDMARDADEEWDDTKVHETSLWAEIDSMVKSDYEQVSIELKTETGEPLPNVGVVVTVEGEEAPRNLTTDNMGKCTTNIPKGVEYIVEANAIEDYAEPIKVIRRASLPKRYIEIVYSAILDVEHVVVEVDYADSSLGTATEIYVDIDGEEFTIPLEGNQATFDVDFGKTYTISFQSVDGYMTPHTRTYKAMHASTKLVIARYMKPIDNVKWLMADGTLREVNNVTNEERLEGNIYGCVVGNSELVTNQKCFTIPTQYLLSGQYPYTGNYLSQNMQITAIGFYDTHAKALLDIDGEFNCAKIREFISEKASQGTNISSSIAQTTYNTYGGYEEFNSDRDYFAGRSVVYEGSIYQFRSRHNKAEWNGNDVQMLYAGFDSSRSYMVGETVFRGGFLWTFKSAHNAGDAWNTSEVNRTNGWIMPDGTLKHAFTPAFGQLYAYRNIRNDLNTVTQSIFSAQCVPFSGVNIWTSTQYGAQHGVLLDGGSFYNGTYAKSIINTLLPVLAY